MTRPVAESSGPDQRPAQIRTMARILRQLRAEAPPAPPPAALHALPAVIGMAAALALFARLDLAAWPREAEAALAIAAGWAFWASATAALTAILLRENRLERRLLEAGIALDADLLRAARAIEAAELQWSGLRGALEEAAPPALQAPLAEADRHLGRVVGLVLTAPNTVGQVRPLLSKSLPRLVDAMSGYLAVVGRSAPGQDISAQTDRAVAALELFAGQARAIEASLFAALQDEADISLEVFDESVGRDLRALEARTPRQGDRVP